MTALEEFKHIEKSGACQCCQETWPEKKFLIKSFVILKAMLFEFADSWTEEYLLEEFEKRMKLK